MSNFALFVGWGGTHPGREHAAQKHYAEFIDVLKGLQSEGMIERFETVLLGPHGGELDGFVLVHGEPEKLAAIQMREDMHLLRSRATLDHTKLSVIPAVTGEEVERELELLKDAVEEYERPEILV